MTSHERHWIAAMRRAESIGYPKNEREWSRLQRAMVAIMYHAARATGVPISKAKAGAELIHGGKGGRILLEIMFEAIDGLGQPL